MALEGGAKQLDLEFGNLVDGHFVGRVNRFVARVSVGGRETVARLANSGRLRDMLIPGARVLLRPADPAAGRSTQFDLVAATIGSSNLLACLDAQSAPTILARAIQKGAVPSLSGYSVVRREPRLGAGRADLLLRAPGGRLVPCECKSVTLVRRDAGLFPDAPTARGARHLRELSQNGGVVAFLVLRPDAARMRANEPVDPVFASELRRAIRSGRVQVVSVVCDVTERGVVVREEVELEWYNPQHIPQPLPDHVAPDMKLLVVGLNPGLYSAWYGMYFARPTNLFWEALDKSRLVREKVGPGDEAYLLRRYGIGFTDLVKRPTVSWDQVSRSEKAEGGARLLELVHRLKPKKMCFVGVSAAREVLGSTAKVGPWPYRLDKTEVFVLPSTSPRQAAFIRPKVLALFREMARWVES